MIVVFSAVDGWMDNRWKWIMPLIGWKQIADLNYPIGMDIHEYFRWISASIQSIITLRSCVGRGVTFCGPRKRKRKVWDKDGPMVWFY